MLIILTTLITVSCKEKPVRYDPTWTSLEQVNPVPEWFKDAKFGIYFHWGVYSVPAFANEWYPRHMYIDGREENLHHIEKYGTPEEWPYHYFITGAAPKYFKEYAKMSFKVPETLFDTYEGRGAAAKSAEMNILAHMNWAGDSKLYPELMDELGIKETWNWDKAAFQSEVGRMNEVQRASWDSVYRPINEAFKKQYPQMSKEELMQWRYQRYMQDYLACIASVDEGVGEVLDYLDENGLAENTILVYTSDQGFYLGEHGWFDKRFMYEESFRTPMVMRFPKEIKPGTSINKLVQNLDFAPTFLDYAGVEIPKDIQGESFRKLVSGETGEWRDAVYYTYYEYPSVHMVKRHYGIATERYKLMHFYYDIDEWEMYDLEKDPQEMRMFTTTRLMPMCKKPSMPDWKSFS